MAGTAGVEGEAGRGGAAGAGGAGDVDECVTGTHGCDASATCVNASPGYVCECATVSFVKENFADPSVVQDCIEADVCLTRGDTQSIYNAAVETQAAAGPGGSAPAGTLWALGSCASVAPADFGTFLSDSFANSSPQSVVDQPGCLYLPDDDTYYSIVFLSWSGGGPGGGFSYDRAQVMDDGVACP
jgi:hypothetical protein